MGLPNVDIGVQNSIIALRIHQCQMEGRLTANLMTV